MIAWVAAAIGLVLTKLGPGWLFTHASPGGGELLRELMWEPPHRFLIGLTLLTALAPILASWRRGTGTSVEVERIRRRRAIGLVGLSGAVLMATLTLFDAALFRRAIDLGVELEGWDFGCIWPSGDHQAAFVGFGRLAVVLRIQAAALDIVARAPRSRRLPQLWRLGLACALAVCAALPFAWLGVEDYVASVHPRSWVLPGVAYVVAFGVLELCAHLGLLGRLGPQRRRSSGPATQASHSTPSPPPGRAQPKLTPDPAALALGHRALARARRWTRLGTLAGSLALIVLAYVGLVELGYAFVSRSGLPPVPAMLVVCGVALACVVFQAPLEGDTPAPLRRPLPSRGLERLAELLRQALAQLERGDDQQFEETYYDFTTRFEALTPDELELLATRGVHLVRLRSLPATWLDAGLFFEAELRRGVHRELMQIEATIIGRPSADPYRADLGSCGLVDAIGLGWLRRGGARDPELGQAHKTGNWAVFAALLAWVATAGAVGLITADVPLNICVPGVGHCRLALHSQEWDLAGLVLLTLAPLVVWAIGLAHRRVATRCFTLALPSAPDEAPAHSPLSSSFMDAYLDLLHQRASWYVRTIAACWLVVVAALGLTVWASIGTDAWLGRELPPGGASVLLGTLVSFALVCARPINHGYRRLCARVWLARLDRHNTSGDELVTATLATMVRHRIELVTSSPPSRDSIEALIASVAAAPLPADDRNAMLERLELVLERRVSLTPTELLALEHELWVLELWVADSGAAHLD